VTTQEQAANRLAGKATEPEQRVASLWGDAFRRLIRNRAALVGLIVIASIVFVALFAEQVAPYGYRDGHSSEARTVPLWLAKAMPGNMEDYVKIGDKFTFGSDYLGRDLLSRVIYGARVSLPVGFMGALTALAIGLVYGCISGYYGGKVDNIMMRIVDIMYAFPTMLLIILLMAFFKTSFGGVAEPGTAAHTFNEINQAVDRLLGLSGGGMLFIFMGIGITAWMGTARLTRGQILSLKEKEFIEASRMIGARDLRIIVRHILPNIVGPILVSVTLGIPGYISTEVFLSFIGLGVDAPTPSWGSMISEGAQAIRSYPHEVLLPALALAILMFAFNFLGDGLRDALDPRMKGTS
jgi:oligopeptide transport system permease protein